MIFKTVFILFALVCLSKARPQADLTEEEEEAIGAFHKALEDFFTELWDYIDYVMDELERILSEWTESADGEQDLTDLEAKMKLMEHDALDIENFIDGKRPSDPMDSVLPIDMEVPAREDDMIEPPPSM